MLCLSLGLSACSDSREPLASAPLAPRRSVAALPTEQDHESVWARYTQDLPGFAGMFYDDNGDLVVLLTDTARASLARERFADRRLRRRPPGPSAALARRAGNRRRGA